MNDTMTTAAVAASGRRAPGRRRREGGQSLVEFALVLPMLLVLVFGILEFGFVLMDQVAVTNAARDGARAGSVRGGSSAAAVAQAQASANGLVSCPVQTPTATYSGSNPQEITMSLQCAYSPVTPLGALLKLIGGSLSTSLTLHGQVAMRVER